MLSEIWVCVVLVDCQRFCFLSAIERQLQCPPSDSICFAELPHVGRLVVGGDSDLLGLKGGLNASKAGKGETKHGKMGHTPFLVKESPRHFKQRVMFP